uniref:Uncharacterized protein n=1 Tax=Chromera velia CCMP2878 TaxID=1169474 RepID=A0A0G4GH36_9ALVE|eukprot:Cvel_21873.t1-p1 / transcript=Cvel_21873.t1 / gene=Cvel_21873 / organism=Chromera_velia_CCMP2878 / gene_product=Ankyrin-1, putative / transcript_product=Ankyrin-1, putative / location=Cvel_scaffold2091:1205-7061(-) / protein_length=716 / sequence_SO=supercontig / SO=protein_coding / is_pseudo=false
MHACIHADDPHEESGDHLHPYKSHGTEGERHKSPFEELMEVLEGYPLAIVQLTLDRMLHEETNGPLAVELLQSAAFFDPGGFSRRLLERAALALVSKDQRRDEKGNAQKGGEGTRPKQGEWENVSETSRSDSLTEETDQAIDLLRHYSLVTDSGTARTARDTGGSGGFVTATELSMHRVVREAALRDKNQPELVTSYSAALTAIRGEEDLLMRDWDSMMANRASLYPVILSEREKFGEICPQLSAVIAHYFSAVAAHRELKKRRESQVAPECEREIGSAVTIPSENALGSFSQLIFQSHVEETSGVRKRMEKLLLVASAVGQRKVVEMLVSRGANVTPGVFEDVGHSALDLAVMHGRKGVVELLIDQEKEAGETALHKASERGDRKMVEFLLSQHATVDAVDNEGLTPLLYAAGVSLEVVKLLLENGATIPTTGSEWRSSLIRAVETGKVELVKFLLEKGADVNVQTKADVDRTVLHEAAGLGNVEIVELLLSHGATLDPVDQCGGTPLFYAAGASLKVVELLLEKGATIPTTDSDLASPLGNAACGGKGHIVKYLLQKGTDVNVQTKRNEGMTALHVAAKFGKREMAQLLLDEGANVDAVDSERFTPLTYAAGVSLEVVKLLLENRATIPTTRSEWRSPLIRAVETGKVELVKFLLEKGADVNVQTKPDAGRTALHVASKQKDKTMIEFLLSKGADLTLLNTEGFAPLVDPQTFQ